MRKTMAVATVLLVPGVLCRAQSFVRDLTGIPFFRDSVPYAEPLSGGLNAPMHQFADADADGDPDLFIFDSDFYPERYFFRNTGNSASPAFALEPGGGFAGASFSFWFRFTDFDGDGATDLLTDDGSDGVRAWRNVNTPEDPVWSVSAALLADTAGAPLPAGFGSLPAFADLSGDGLPDFLSGNTADGSFNYYRNIGTPGAAAYSRVSNRLSGIVITSDTCSVSPAAAPDARKPMHGLGAATLEDLDADGLLDICYGDVFSHSLFPIRNVGTPQEPVLECPTNTFPPDGSLVTDGFNQATFADIDADGDPDLFVGVLNSRTRGSFWFYRNTGSPGAPAFTLATKEYIRTLDAGQNSKPALADLDGDLDADLLIGSNNGGLWYFRNEGSTLSPVYRLADTAFGGITGGFSYAPALGDIDADGDPDLLLGRFDGTVTLYRNDGPGGFTPADTLTAGQYAAPALGDVDSDGDQDLIVGKGNGTLSFFRNAGTPGVPDFVPETGSYLGTDFGDNATPATRFNPSTGRTDLYVSPAAGDTAAGRRGRIVYYRNVGSPAEPPFALEDERFGPDVPYLPAPVFCDLDADGDDDLLTGTSKGGLAYYRGEPATGADDRGRRPAGFRLEQNYPNPFNSSTVITVGLDSASDLLVDIFDLNGRRVRRLAGGRRGPGIHRLVWDAAGLPSGVYLCRVAAGGSAGCLRMSHLR